MDGLSRRAAATGQLDNIKYTDAPVERERERIFDVPRECESAERTYRRHSGRALSSYTSLVFKVLAKRTGTSTLPQQGFLSLAVVVRPLSNFNSTGNRITMEARNTHGEMETKSRRSYKS